MKLEIYKVDIKCNNCGSEFSSFEIPKRVPIKIWLETEKCVFCGCSKLRAN